MCSEYRVLVVCKGNICRSAIAAEVLRAESKQLALSQGLQVRSVGTESYHEGKGAHPLAIKVAGEHGYDLSGHLATVVSRPDVEWADVIIVMDQANVRRLRELFVDDLMLAKVTYLTEFIDGRRLDVVDPYQQPYEVFQQVFDIILQGCRGFLRSRKSL